MVKLLEGASINCLRLLVGMTEGQINLLAVSPILQENLQHLSVLIDGRSPDLLKKIVSFQMFEDVSSRGGGDGEADSPLCLCLTSF
ncbi:hypothetical protein BCY86_03940 [Pajaroellobacter abortibovis]|uniref:Uncharacterized protein n=2 Tax=Pajaroellobacter abortibovis TaxID=1882918 RepID=A0A1L6MWL1_9BACT|nr:hypothetical protein BCY86_03940 [Pajaroellobacter abortibovis]